MVKVGGKKPLAPPVERSKAVDEGEGVPESGFGTAASKVSGGPGNGGSGVRPNGRDPHSVMGAEKASAAVRSVQKLDAPHMRHDGGWVEASHSRARDSRDAFQHKYLWLVDNTICPFNRCRNPTSGNLGR